MTLTLTWPSRLTLAWGALLLAAAAIFLGFWLSGTFSAAPVPSAACKAAVARINAITAQENALFAQNGYNQALEEESLVAIAHAHSVCPASYLNQPIFTPLGLLSSMKRKKRGRHEPREPQAVPIPVDLLALRPDGLDPDCKKPTRPDEPSPYWRFWVPRKLPGSTQNSNDLMKTRLIWLRALGTATR